MYLGIGIRYYHLKKLLDFYNKNYFASWFLVQSVSSYYNVMFIDEISRIYYFNSDYSNYSTAKIFYTYMSFCQCDLVKKFTNRLNCLKVKRVFKMKTDQVGP